jgi:glycosyltransferase involved in cell wall biosynthesis
MKIAHFIYYGPRRSGMYETTRDLCEAECKLGHEAKLIDTSWITNKKPEPESFRFDRGVDVATTEWAKEADAHVLHSIIPQDLWGTKPTIVALHGAPEYCFYSELHSKTGKDKSFSTLLYYNKTGQVNKFVTFWEHHLPYWQTLFGDDNVSYVPAFVSDMDMSPDGEAEEFKDPGEINIGFCDTWRSTLLKDPFMVIPGVREYWKRDKRAKLQLFAAPSVKKRDRAWDRLILQAKSQSAFIGDVWELHSDMAKVYRALDLIVSPVNTASRIVRESQTCGTPIITAHGNTHTPYTCDIWNPSSISDAIESLVTELDNNPESVKQGCLDRAKTYDSSVSAKQFCDILESVCA